MCLAVLPVPSVQGCQAKAIPALMHLFIISVGLIHQGICETTLLGRDVVIEANRFRGRTLIPTYHTDYKSPSLRSVLRQSSPAPEQSYSRVALSFKALVNGLHLSP